MTQPSPNLTLNHLVEQRRAAGEPLVNLTFGEARLPVIPELAQQLAAGAHRASYGPVAGAEDARSAVAGYFARRGLPTDPADVVLAPGSKPLLMALNLAVDGDVLLPRPAWNTYAPQARYAGKEPIAVPVPDVCGEYPSPARCAWRSAVPGPPGAPRACWSSPCPTTPPAPSPHRTWSANSPPSPRPRTS